MLDELLLLSGNDIPFPEAKINIHQPTLREIGLITEETFHYAAKFLNFSTNDLSEQDKTLLEGKTDFDIFMAILNNKEEIKFKQNTILILTLLFPLYNIRIASAAIIFTAEDGSQAAINFQNFDNFKQIISEMFCLNGMGDGKEDFNPADGIAQRIADKLRKARERKAKEKGQNLNKVAIFSRYISILAVGLQKNINELLDYTVYQLYDEFQRFSKKQANDIYIQAKMAGATGLEEVDNWMDDIHP